MQIDWWTLALQTINFLVVIWLLSRFLYRPVRQMIEARETADRKAAEEAAAKIAEAEEARKSYEEKRAALDEEARKADAAFHARIEQERQAMQDAARAEADRMRAEARDRIARDHDEALKRLQGQIADLARSLARKALEDLPADAGDVLARAAARIDQLSEEDRADLSREVSAEGASVTVVSAAPLPDSLRRGWRDTLAHRFGPQTRVMFEEDPEILGGYALRFPHAVMDFSVAGRLQRAAQTMET